MVSAELAFPKNVLVPLLATRFFPPPLQATCISRPRLSELLNEGSRRKLILVSAPPGFGKSSLLVEWLHGRPDIQAGWLSLEPSDQDWGMFFRYLVAAWQRIFPRAGQSALAELDASPTPARETLANLLLNDLLSAQGEGGTGQALLVLDDYHRIESAPVHETMTYLVEHLPPRCHLALLTRADPPLPLARWRSRGQALELRADDLRFTAEEAAQYLNQSMRLNLTGEQIAVLQERTEGWVVGLQMAALSLQGRKGVREQVSAFVRDFGGSNRFVIDYLVEEVVRQQPEEIQRFLFASALLDQFCGPLCDALLDAPVPYSQGVLERLEKANLFLIALDDLASGAGARYWFRYHHLFAELLRMRMQQTHPEQVAALYRRAAEWFAKNNLGREAVRYALQTKDMDYSAAVFEQAILKGGLAFLYSGMRPLVEPFPAETVHQRPLLSLAKAVAMFESSQLEGVKPLLRFAEQNILASPPFPGLEDVLGWIYVIQGNVATMLGDSAWMIEASQQVPLRIPNDLAANIEALIEVGNTYYYAGHLNQTAALFHQALDLSQASKDIYYTLNLLDLLGRICFMKGENNRAEALFQQGLRLQEEYPEQYQILLGVTLRDYAELLRERNHLDEVRAMLNRALPLCEKYPPINNYECVLIYMSRLLLSLGDIVGAHAMIDQVDELRRTHTMYPDLDALAQVSRGRIYLEEGQPEQAWQTLEKCLQSACCQHEFHREWALMAQGRILARAGRPAEAIELIGGRLESAKANGRGRNWMTMCLITALALNASGDHQKAFRLLGDVLEFGKGQGFRRVFIDEGEPIRALLEDFRVQSPRSPLAEEVAEILAAFPVPPAGEPGSAVKVADLVEPLSPREIEILRLVCQGLSNQEIARRLVLSVGTVKFHIHNVFGKLGVRDRPQAIAKAGMMGLGRT